MADEELQMEEGGKKKSKLLIIIIAVVVLIAGGGAAYYFLMGSDDPAPVSDDMVMADDTVDDGEVLQSTTVKTGTALYVPIPGLAPFNAPGSTRNRFVEIKVQLMVRGSDNEERVQTNIPLIKGALLRAFSAASADDLVTEAGKMALRDSALTEVQKTLVEYTGNKTVEAVLFTGFVMQ